MGDMTTTVYIEEPPAARVLFGSTRLAWLWLVVRLWLGWEWLAAGWEKTFGGTITWKFWDWGGAGYHLTGNANCGWIRSCVVTRAGTTSTAHVGDAVKGFASGAIQNAEGPHPDVAYSWYVHFLDWVRDSGHAFLGVVIPLGELLVGAALILGLFTGIAAGLGAVMNFSYVFAGSAGVNPAMIAVSFGVILAWRVAGWYGADRWVLPRIGTPWQRGVASARTPARRAEDADDSS